MAPSTMGMKWPRTSATHLGGVVASSALSVLMSVEYALSRSRWLRAMANSLFVTPPYGQVSAATLNASAISVSESVGATQNREDNAQSCGPSPMRVGFAVWRWRSKTESRSMVLAIRRRQVLRQLNGPKVPREKRGMGLTIPVSGAGDVGRRRSSSLAGKPVAGNPVFAWCAVARK